MSLDLLSYEQIQGREEDGDRLLIVSFFNKAVQTNQLDEDEKPVFVDKEYVRIEIPGSREGARVFQANENHKKRFAAQYKAFKENRETPIDGTPIEELAGILDSQVQRCKAYRIRTIEQLAGIADETIDKLGPNSRKLHEKAVRYTQGPSKLEAELKELKKQNEELQEQVKALMQQAKPKTRKGKADEHSNDDSERGGQDGADAAPDGDSI